MAIVAPVLGRDGRAAAHRGTRRDRSMFQAFATPLVAAAVAADMAMLAAGGAGWPVRHRVIQVITNQPTDAPKPTHAAPTQTRRGPRRARRGSAVASGRSRPADATNTMNGVSDDAYVGQA